MTSHAHHSEAGLIMSATDISGPVMTQMNVGMPEVINTGGSGLNNRSVGSRAGSEQSNVCKVSTRSK